MVYDAKFYLSIKIAHALALVRRELSNHQTPWCLPHHDAAMANVPWALLQSLTDAACYAA